MQINPVNSIFIFRQQGLPNVSVQTKKNNFTENKIDYSLWNTSQKLSFCSKKKRSYSSLLPAKYEKPSKFKIARIPNLTCPACGQKILTRSQYTRFLEEIRKAKEEDYIPILENYEKYMCPTELEVFQDIKERAEEIKREGETPHINDIVKQLREMKLPELEKIQLDLVEDMREALSPLPKSEQNTINKKLDTISDIIINANNKAPFRRKTLIESVRQYPVSDSEVKERLTDIAESFPSSGESACAWVVKNAGKDKQGNDRTPLELAEKLVGIASTSTDHILARNIELNHDDITNYMAMHKGCNSEKTDKSFNEWFDENPVERKKYIRNYLNGVKSAIESGKIKDRKYRHYIQDCVENIYKLSKGKVDFREEFCPDTSGN